MVDLGQITSMAIFAFMILEPTLFEVFFPLGINARTTANWSSFIVSRVILLSSVACVALSLLRTLSLGKYAD